MNAGDNCGAAVHSQSHVYEKNKAAPPSGFKAISFRVVNGPGYSGVEFVQKVPSGKIDYERWVCGPRRLYVLVSDWNPGEPEPKELLHIVDSFRILSKN